MRKLVFFTGSPMSTETTKKRECVSCPNREWSDGDPEYSPPGYGVYFCRLLHETSGALPHVFSNEGAPDNCPVNL